MGVCSTKAHHVSAQVDAEDGDGAQRQRDVDQDEEQEGRDLRDVTGQSVGNGFLQVIEDQPTCRVHAVCEYIYIIQKTQEILSFVRFYTPYF